MKPQEESKLAKIRKASPLLRGKTDVGYYSIVNGEKEVSKEPEASSLHSNHLGPESNPSIKNEQAPFQQFEPPHAKEKDPSIEPEQAEICSSRSNNSGPESNPFAGQEEAEAPSHESQYAKGQSTESEQVDISSSYTSHSGPEYDPSAGHEQIEVLSQQFEHLPVEDPDPSTEPGQAESFSPQPQGQGQVEDTEDAGRMNDTQIQNYIQAEEQLPAEPVQAELSSPQLEELSQRRDEDAEPMHDSQTQMGIQMKEEPSAEPKPAPMSLVKSALESDWEENFLQSLNNERPEDRNLVEEESTSAKHEDAPMGVRRMTSRSDWKTNALQSLDADPQLNDDEARDSIYAKPKRAPMDQRSGRPTSDSLFLEEQMPEEQTDSSTREELYFGDLEKLRTAEDGICSNIHILGTGNIGKFIAHSLAGMVNGPQVTLLLHRPLRIQEWYDEGQGITLYTKEEPNIRTGFAIESSSSIEFSPDESYPAFGPNLETSIVPPTSIIDHLIVTTKATKTISALESVKSRLRPTSTICFIHNGMGVVEQINEKVFPNPVTRPNYVFGTISHGVGSIAQRKFSCTYNGNGVLDICSIDRYYSDHVPPGYSIQSRDLVIERKSVGYPPSVRYLMRTLTRCAELKASGHSYNKFFLIQLDKLAVNAVINPLSVIYDCKNKELLHNEHITATIHSLLREISAVILALPELRSLKMTRSTSRATLERRFSPQMLYPMVVGVANKTGSNFSSTLQDVKRGEHTEIGFINGYIVKRGRELGIETPLNDFVLNSVRGKQKNVKKKIDGYIPFETPLQ